MGNAATVIGPKAQLVVGSIRYDLQTVQARFGYNGVNVCVVNLAVGRREDGNSISVANFNRGDEARVVIFNAGGTSTAATNIAFNQDSYTLFDGVVDDVGPSDLSFGSFAVQVRLFGRLAYLASGALDSHNIIPKSHLDTAVFWAYGQGEEDAPGQINARTAIADFWSALQDALNTIATSGVAPQNSVTNFIQDTYGSDVNSDAATVLGEIVGSLDWRPAAEALVPGIVAKFNELMMRQWYFEPFLHRIIAFGEMLRFKIVETGSVIRVVPHHPFFTNSNAYQVYPGTYDKVSWDTSSEYRNYAGSVLVEGGGNDLETSTEDLVVGFYKMGGNPLGQVHVGTVPNFLAQATNNMFTGGTGVRTFRALGNTDIAGRLAKIQTWELNYGNRRFQFECPFLRADIAPLTAIRLIYPDSAEIVGGTGDFAIFGCVEAVDVMLDATQGYARTAYTVGHARSSEQQQRIINADLGVDEHPFFTQNYIGARLDSSQARGGAISAG